MLTTLKSESVTKWTWSGTRFVRKSPSEKHVAVPNRLQLYKRARYYDADTGEFISRDPLEYVDGMSLYRGYFVPGAVDPFGLGKGKVIGWIVRRASGNNLIKVRAIMTDVQLAKAFLKGSDVLVKNGSKHAKRIAVKVQSMATQRTGKIIKGGNHAAGHVLPSGLRGAPHVQLDRIANRHIFYSAIGALAGAAIATDQTSAAESDRCEAEYSVDVSEVYTNERPGQSWAHGLTVSYWAGEDSYLGLADWVNPLELVAMGGDLGRHLDRESLKQLVGINVLVTKKGGQTVGSFAFSSEGELLSVTPFSANGVGEPVPANSFFKNLGEADAGGDIMEAIGQAIGAN